MQFGKLLLTSICVTKFRNLRNRFCEDEMEAIIIEDKNPTQFSCWEIKFVCLWHINSSTAETRF